MRPLGIPTIAIEWRRWPRCLIVEPIFEAILKIVRTGIDQEDRAQALKEIRGHMEAGYQGSI